jgi:hypothetical protein
VKLVMTLLARNEEDVIEENLVYHLNRGVDFVIATDNASDDGTRDILQRFAEEGHLHLIDEPSHTYDQGRWVTRMARLAATDFGADWVINNDADEFWWPDLPTLKDVLEEIPEQYHVLSAPRTNFLPPPQEAEGESFVERMVVRERHSFNPTGHKPLVPKAVHRARADIRVDNGGHRVDAPGMHSLTTWQPIEIFHFPVRSYRQWEGKIRIAYEARTSAALNVYSGLRATISMLEEGRLPEAYAELAVSPADVESGAGDGKLLVDRRLQAFLAAVREPVGVGGPALAPDSPQAPELSPLDEEGALRRAAALVRAMNANQHEPLIERDRLLRKGKRRRQLEVRIQEMEQSRWWRLGQRLERIAAGPRRLLGRELPAASATSYAEVDRNGDEADESSPMAAANSGGAGSEAIAHHGSQASSSGSA